MITVFTFKRTMPGLPSDINIKICSNNVVTPLFYKGVTEATERCAPNV